MKPQTILKLLISGLTVTLISCNGFNEKLAAEISTELDNYNKKATDFCNCVAENMEGNKKSDCSVFSGEADKAKDTSQKLLSGKSIELGEELSKKLHDREFKTTQGLMDCKNEYRNLNQKLSMSENN